MAKSINTHSYVQSLTKDLCVVCATNKCIRYIKGDM